MRFCGHPGPISLITQQHKSVEPIIKHILISTWINLTREESMRILEGKSYYIKDTGVQHMGKGILPDISYLESHKVSGIICHSKL